jgi:hypothetical protein
MSFSGCWGCRVLAGFGTIVPSQPLPCFFLPCGLIGSLFRLGHASEVGILEPLQLSWAHIVQNAGDVDKGYLLSRPRSIIGAVLDFNNVCDITMAVLALFAGDNAGYGVRERALRALRRGDGYGLVLDVEKPFPSF